MTNETATLPSTPPIAGEADARGRPPRRWLRRIVLIGAGGVAVTVLAASIFLAATWSKVYSTERAVVIERAPREVWPWLAPDRISAWQPDVAMTPVEGHPERWRIVIAGDPESEPAFAETLSSTENEAIDVRVWIEGFFDSDVRYRLTEPTPGTTRLVFEQDSRYEHLLMKLFAPLMSAHCEAHLDTSLAKLKELAEAEQPGVE